MKKFRYTLVVAALLFVACDKQSSIRVGTIYTLSPSQSSDGEVVPNFIEFHYNLKEPEIIHVLIDEDESKTIQIDGKGKWRIELLNSRLTATGNDLIFEIPTELDGTIESNVGMSESKQMTFDISVDGTKIITIVCPNHIIGSKVK